jgi:hypothetical protein
MAARLSAVAASVCKQMVFGSSRSRQITRPHNSYPSLDLGTAFDL